MRTIRLVALAALVSLPGLRVAAADEALHLTPPLFRDQARATQLSRSASDLTTAPQPVFANRSDEAAARRRIAEAGEPASR